MRDVKRIFMKQFSGAASGFDGGADADARDVLLQTSSIWDTEIALTGLDKLVGTPTINAYDHPLQSPTEIPVEDGDIIGYDASARTLTYKVYGPDSGQIVALKGHHNKKVKFFFVLRGGYVRVNKWVDVTTDVFFEAESCAVYGPVQAPGTARDYIEIKLAVKPDALDAFEDVLAGAFTLTV